MPPRHGALGAPLVEETLIEVGYEYCSGVDACHSIVCGGSNCNLVKTISVCVAYGGHGVAKFIASLGRSVGGN